MGELEMGREHPTEGQIVGMLKEHEAGGTAKESCCRHVIWEQTSYRWESKYGGMEASGTRRLRHLEADNSKLKRLLAQISHQCGGLCLSR